MEEKKIKMRYEILGDIDGVLYVEYEDGTLENIHTKIEFDKSKQRQEYTPLYQFKDGKLVGYSKHKAEGLTIEDDLNKGENLLWGTRGKDGKKEIIFRPIKDLEIPHIKAILIDRHTNNKEYLIAMVDRLTSIINI